MILNRSFPPVLGYDYRESLKQSHALMMTEARLNVLSGTYCKASRSVPDFQSASCSFARKSRGGDHLPLLFACCWAAPKFLLYSGLHFRKFANQNSGELGNKRVGFSGIEF